MKSVCVVAVYTICILMLSSCLDQCIAVTVTVLHSVIKKVLRSFSSINAISISLLLHAFNESAENIYLFILFCNKRNKKMFSALSLNAWSNKLILIAFIELKLLSTFFIILCKTVTVTAMH